jgi:UDPglucose 6-dehydrogenase
LAACFASRGFDVIGVDHDPARVTAMNRGEPPVDEPQLREYLAAYRAALRATTEIGEAVAHSSATVVIVATPSNRAGQLSTEHVLSACGALGRALTAKRTYHLVVIASTVPPRCTATELLPTLERHSGKQCGRDFGLCYGPEFVALGAVIPGFLRPEFALIGEHDCRAGDALEQIYTQLFEQPAPIVRTNIVSAEIAKLAVNAFLATKIGFANLLAQLCERVPGADVDAVTAVMGRDARIGRRFLTGGVSYGGPCLPRDVQALGSVCALLGVDAALPDAVDRVNRGRLDDLVRLVRDVIASTRRRTGRPPTVGILGLAFKPGTSVADASPGLLLAERLAADAPVVVHDPRAQPPLRAGVRRATHAAECVAAADIVVIATPWPEYATLPAGSLARRVVIDGWRILDAQSRADLARYIALGVGRPPAS